MPTLSRHHRLSATGSTRATAYTVANKSVRIGDTTHVTWLDAVARVMLASYDHVTETWSEPYFLDDGVDNHTNPALSASSDGYLRIAYGPHGFWEAARYNEARFRFQIATAPNCHTEWQHVHNPGFGATYACLVTDSQNRDHLVYRGGTSPPKARYERRLPDNAFDRDTALSHITGIDPRYTFVNANLVIAPGDVLYAGFIYYHNPPGASQGVCVIKSPDGGTTWTGVDDSPVALPLAYDKTHAPPHGVKMPYLGSLTVMPDGRVAALTNDHQALADGHYFSVHDGRQWRATALGPFMPEGWCLMQSCCTCDAAGRVLIAGSAVPRAIAEDGSTWSHPHNEIFLLTSTDQGRNFTAQQVSETDPTTANWLANISRPGPNHDLRTPLLLWTHGVKGEGCAPPDETEVWAAWVGE